MTPLCVECGRERPEGRTEAWCVPCANTGHNFNIITSTDDAWRSIMIWMDHYRKHAYTPTNLRGIPSWKRLVGLVSDGDQVLRNMLMGECVVVDHETLDRMSTLPLANQLASCKNRRRCGVRDEFVAWLFMAPTDLVFNKDMTATGSGKYSSEIGAAS